MKIRHAALLLALACVLGISRESYAQIDSRMVLDPIAENSFGATNDRILFQAEGDVQGEHDKNAQVFWWQSDGRFRLSKTDESAPMIGYHWTTMNFDTNSDVIPEHLDNMGLGMGFRLGEIAEGKVSLVLGVGWTGNNPFDNETGLYGSGHVTWERPINKTDSLVLSIDYQGDSAFLPDWVLPGFQYVHKTDTLSYGFGYPRSWVQWKILDQLVLDGYYAVPYTGDVSLSYFLTSKWSVFGGYSNSFDGFVISEQDATDRLFYQMSRAEVGIRYRDPNFMQKFFLDASLVIGYAFEQNFYNGFDVRDISRTTKISDEPYIGLVIVGRF